MSDIYWLNKDSRKFLERGYLVEGETPEERIWNISQRAEEILGIEGFGVKFPKLIPCIDDWNFWIKTDFCIYR